MRDIISTKAVWPSEDETGKMKGSRLVLAATFGIPALLVVGLLLLLISFQDGIETAVANLALLLPVGYAFAAGMVASVNPCGIMMLSSYAFYQVRSEGSRTSSSRRALWGLLVAVVVTLGFVPGKQVSVDPQRSLGNSFVFGLVYAVASLSCTLPIFLAVVGGALVSGGLLSSLGQFIGYALGMGVVIFVVTIGAALARRAMARWLRALTPYVHRLSAMFLVGAGVYLIYYWLFKGGLVS